MSKTKLMLREFNESYADIFVSPDKQEVAMGNFFEGLYAQEDQPVVILPNRKM